MAGCVLISAKTPVLLDVVDGLQSNTQSSIEITHIEVSRLLSRPGLEEFATQYENWTPVILSDASQESLPTRFLSRCSQAIQWHLDYFVPVGVALRNEISLSGVDRTSLAFEIQHAAYCFFSNERSAIAARDESRLAASRIGVLPYPLEYRSVSKRESGGKRLVFALASPPSVEYRSTCILRALLSIEDKSPGIIWMCEEQELEQIRDIAREFPEIDVSTVVGRSPTTWSKILRQSDCAVHLSESPYELYTYYLAMSLASGIRVMCSTAQAASDVPESICSKIPPGVDELPSLEKSVALFSGSNERDAAELQAQEAYVQVVHSPAMVRNELLSTLGTYGTAITSASPIVLAECQEDWLSLTELL